MRNYMVFVSVIMFALGLTTNGFGQNNQAEQDKDSEKETTQEVWNNDVVDLSFGINKVYVPLLTTHMGLNPYDNKAWELELRTNYKSGFSSVHVFEVYNLNDKNVFPTHPNSDELDEWVVSGRGYAYRYLMHAPSIRGSRFNSYSIFGGGFWLRHEAHRFRPLKERDVYPLGFNMTAGYGFNFLPTKNIVLSTDWEIQMNIPSEMQFSRLKMGLHYKFK